MPLHRMLLLAVISLLVLACTKSVQVPFGKDPVAEGIYSVTSYKKVDGHCDDAELVEQVPRENYYFVKKKDFFGVTFYSLYGCKSPEECRNNAHKESEGESFSVEFSMSVPDNASGKKFSGELVSTGVDSNGICTDGSIVKQELEVLNRSTMNIIASTRKAPDYQYDLGGYCSTDGVKEAAQSIQCTTEAFHGTYIAEL